MSFPLILTLVATLAVLAATFVLVALLRRLRPHDPLSGDDDSLSASVDSQLREMTERIEATVTQQQEQDETQRQRLAQQIDGVQQGVGEQRVLLDNLRSEVRHESKRRDHELDEIRDQIASIHNALPTLGAAPEGEALALPPASEASAPADPFVSETQDLVDSARSTDAAPDWAEVAWEVDAGSIASDAPAGADPATALDNDAIFTFEDAFVDASFEDVTADAEEAVTPEAPTPEAIAPEALASEAIAEEAPDEPTDVPAPFDTEPEAAPADVVAEAPAPPPAFDAPAFVGLAVAEPTPSPEMPIDELASPDLPSAPDAAAPNVWGVQPDAPGEAEGPAEAVFEELTLAEMSIEEFAFADFALEIDAEDDGAPGDVQMGAFDADPFTIEEAADPFVVTDEASETAPLPQEGSPEPDAALTSPEPTPASPQAEPDASAQSDAAEPPSAPTAFVGDPLPAADPLAFEEAFVPTPIVDAAPEPTEMGDDLFAAWSPTETPEPAPEPLAFVEAPAPPPGDHAADPEAAPAAAPADASSTGLSAFEDWGLDPVPVAAPASDAAWTAPETAPDASETWVPSQTTPPPPPPTPPPAPEPPSATAWVARNESIQPTPPPAAQPAAPADAAPYAETDPVADPAELASEFEPQPAQAEPLADAAGAYATFPVELSSSLAPAPATTPAPAAPAPAEPAAAELAAAPPAASGGSEEDAERFTVLPSIDEDTERALRLAGVTSLDEMARWGRTEARRIASAVGVSEDTVLNHWVFEAQTALFERFTQQTGV